MPNHAESGDLQRLLARCRRGDSRAWSELIERFRSLVYSIPRRMGMGEDDAGDVFQATFVALYRSLHAIEDGQALPKWVATTAARESYRVRRLSGRYVTVDDDARALDEVLQDDEERADETAIRASEADWVRQGVRGLGAQCRDLLTALYVEGLAYQEVVTALGIPIGSIGPTRARCLEKLRRTLEAEGFFVG
ncbi:MAG: RNA polymerase sigma factor [Fimbriimonadaceae bacterium]|nr:RNA polymerase sigma factor [Fimbriimonadaceae bacterium]